MTKEEAILVLDSLSTWFGYERPITEEIVEAIKTLSKPLLPFNLFQAKLAFSERRFPDEKMAPLRRAARIGYEAGAEWMAEQGETFEGVIRDNGFIDFDEYGSSMMIPSNVSCFNNGDKVIIQIRKKY